jgi:hypothetical protein
MIHNLFYSSINKNSIKEIINETINRKFNIKINKEYDMIINDTMDYVISQVNTNPPKGVSMEEYIFLMNKKVYELVLPIIIKKIEIIKNKKKEKIIEPIFDQLLLKNYENIPIMEYPKSSLKNNLKNNVVLKNIEEERSTLIPKIRPIDFTNKENENIKNNTVELYNNLLSSYNNDIIINNTSEISEKSNLDILNNFNKDSINNQSNNLNILNKDSINDQSNDLNILNNFNKDSINNQSNDLHELLTINRYSNNIKLNEFNTDSPYIPTNNFDEFNEFNTDSPYIPTNNFDKFNEFNTDSPYIPTNDFENINKFNTDSPYIPTNNFDEFNEFNTDSPYIPTNDFENINNLNDEIDFIEKSCYIIVDSHNRDYNKYPSSSLFTEYLIENKDELYYDKYNKLLFKNKNNLKKYIKNITSISCKSITIPSNKDIYNESYLYLNIEELTGPYKGNTTLDKSFSRFSFNNINLNENKFITVQSIDDYDYYNKNIISLTLNLTNKTGKNSRIDLDLDF